MVTGLGLAESTPGPLIMVTEFVGFVGRVSQSWRARPAVAGVIGALVTTWATFAPCSCGSSSARPTSSGFAGTGPSTATCRRSRRPWSAWSLNLAVTFAIRSLFEGFATARSSAGRSPSPRPARSTRSRLVVAVASFVALWRFKVNILWVIGVAAVAGVVRVTLL